MIDKQRISSTIMGLAAVVLLLGGCGLLGGDNSSCDIPGKIVFAAEEDEGFNSQIFTMNACGDNVKQLTSGRDSYSPSWNPDGTQIVFSSSKGALSTGPAIWVMDADGSNQRFLHHPDPDNEHAFPILGRHPRWSPDGTKVVFDLCTGCQGATDYKIWMFDTLTKELTQLTEHWETLGHPASDHYPSWHPDGTQIAFSSNRDYITGDTLRYFTDLYIMDADGKNQTRVTENAYIVGLPNWDFNEHNVEYITYRSLNPTFGIYQMNLTTGEVFPIVKDPLEYVFQYPQTWSSLTSQLLIRTFQRNPDPEEQTTVSKLLILDTQTDKLREVHSKTTRNSNGVISSADWFVPEE